LIGGEGKVGDVMECIIEFPSLVFSCPNINTLSMPSFETVHSSPSLPSIYMPKGKGASGDQLRWLAHIIIKAEYVGEQPYYNNKQFRPH
jgi:hypothetical protein